MRGRARAWLLVSLAWPHMSGAVCRALPPTCPAPALLPDAEALHAAAAHYQQQLGQQQQQHLQRKSRLVWTQELHNRFLNALSHLGLRAAVPKSM